MSLLMKALEKAAKDREGTESAAGKDAISLEPMPARAAPQPRDPAPVAAPAEPASRNKGAAESSNPASAATVVNAGRRSGGAGAFMRERPLAVFGLLAGIGAAGYAGYVYLQLTNPALFVKQAPRPVQTAQITPPPPAAPIAPPATPVQTPPPLASLSAPETVTPPPVAQPVKGATPAIPPSGANTTGTAAAVVPRPAAAVEPERKGGPATASNTPASAAPPVAPLPLAPAPAIEAPRDTIKVTTGSTAAVVNPLLTEGYTALNAGNLDASQRLYNQMLRGDPGSIDALLGLAAIATQQGNADEATRRYLKVLELEPRNAPAQAGLISMLGRADPQSAETRLKQLIAREPAAAFLQFALGVSYIDQKRWPDAQQAFFQAHQLQPDNPDYAFNLAVALEHIGQPKFALDYYRRALQLATAKGRANFSTVSAEERIGKLEKAVR